MELIPAIDLVDGRVVRLAQGDFDRQTTYGRDPLEIAGHWTREGATRLHIVDLDGARAGLPVQSALIGRIVAAAGGVPCQVAGGLRDAASVAAMLDAGADRVVMGSALLTNPALAEHLLALHGPDRIVAAIDVRDGLAVGAGWVPGAAGKPVDQAIAELRVAGIALFAVTAIARDGLGSGPDLALLERAAAIVGRQRVIASAGVASVDDVSLLARRGYAAAILGRALYEGTLSLGAAQAAITAAQRDGSAPAT